MQSINIFKSTSLVYVIGLRDFLTAADLIGGRDNRLTEMYIFVAVVFFVICWTASQGVSHSRTKDRPLITIDHVSKWYGREPAFSTNARRASRRAKWSWCAARRARARAR